MLDIMCVQVHDSRCCVASMQYRAYDEVKLWTIGSVLRHQWLGIDIDKPHVNRLWQEIGKLHHDWLKHEVIGARAQSTTNGIIPLTESCKGSEPGQTRASDENECIRGRER